MELSAIIHALTQLPEHEAHVIYSDSKLCVQTLNVWVHSWAKNKWKRSNGKPPENIDLVQEAHVLAQRHPLVRFEWIKAHSR